MEDHLFWFVSVMFYRVLYHGMVGYGVPSSVVLYPVSRIEYPCYFITNLSWMMYSSFEMCFVC